MTQTKTVLVMDPSGNFKEGQGTTGWVLMDSNQKVIRFGQVMSKQYGSRTEYHDAHIQLILEVKPSFLVCENYVLYGDKASSQINSELETPRLLGVLEHFCYVAGIPYATQPAHAVKARWSDAILVHKGMVVWDNGRSYIDGIVISRHIKDALRHAMHFTSFNKEWKECKN